MRAFLITLCMLVGTSFHAYAEDIYIVLSSSFTPNKDISYNDIRSSRNGEMVVAHVACYPIKYKNDIYSEDTVKQAFNDFIQARDKGTKVHRIEVSTFEDRGEAKKFYDSLTKSRKKKAAKRIPFTKSHIDRAHRKVVLAMREEEKAREQEEKDNQPVLQPIGKPPVIKPPVAKPLANRAIDDIYD